MKLFHRKKKKITQQDKQNALIHKNSRITVQPSQEQKKVNDFIASFKPSRHHVMQHYLIKFGTAALCLSVGFGFAWHHNAYVNMKEAETLTNYSSSVSFSKTSDTSLKLSSVQLNKSRNTAYVPFTLNDMNDISSDADKYSVLVGGALQKMPSGTMTGQLILFGSTARGVIILHCAHRIPNKPIVVILRSNAKLGTGSGSSDDVDTSADSNGIKDFETEFNALDFKINPDAKDTKVNPKLSTNDSLDKIYGTIFGRKDLKQVQNENKKNRHEIMINQNRSNEYMKRLKQFGFRLPRFKKGYGKNDDQPGWMNPKWLPYDYIMKDGVPKNKKGKVSAKNIEADAAYSSVTPSTDAYDNVTFPQVLKKKDGTTTDSTNNNSVAAGSNGNSNDNSNIDGGDTDSPSSLWSNLQQAWDSILKEKHNIYSINASTLFRIKATIHDVNTQASVGSKKHFRQAN